MNAVLEEGAGKETHQPPSESEIEVLVTNDFLRKVRQRQFTLFSATRKSASH